MRPQTEAELAEMIQTAQGPLRITGGGTRPIGRPVSGEPLETGGLSGISLYEPGALTLVAKAGTPLSDINSALDAEGQRLAFEPMDHRTLLGTQGTPTIGGVVAGNISGPRRIQSGACRDFMVGVRLVDGAGTIVKNGGRVMKNVTGYDLVKLMSGSWGTLGVLTEVSLKVLPKPEATATVHVPDASGLTALAAMTAAITSPFDVSGVADLPGRGVVVRVEGFEGSVRYRAQQLQDLLAAHGNPTIEWDAERNKTTWQDVRDATPLQQHSHVWRISMKPSAVYSGLLAALDQSHAADVFTDWAGGLCWIGLTPTSSDEAAQFHHMLQNAVANPEINENGGGHATLIKAPEALRQKIPVFQPQNPVLETLAKGIRAKFDPRGLLNPGIMSS
jgi:glycolate oxidase FAD binding subunit